MRNLTFVLIAFFALLSACKTADTTPVYAEWAFPNGDHYTAYGSTLTGTVLESDCDNNNKMWITLGSIPTQNTMMKVVSYNKASLESDEMKIDIAHFGDDYLSAGTDNKMAKVDVTGDQLYIYLDTVLFARYNGNGPAGDSTTITGYLDKL